MARLSLMIAILASVVVVVGIQPGTVRADLGCSAVVDGSQKCNGWPDSGGDVYWGKPILRQLHSQRLYVPNGTVVRADGDGRQHEVRSVWYRG